MRRRTRLELELTARVERPKAGTRGIGRVRVRVLGCPTLSCSGIAYELARVGEPGQPEVDCPKCGAARLLVRDQYGADCEVNAKMRIARVRRVDLAGNPAPGAEWLYVPFLPADPERNS